MVISFPQRFKHEIVPQLGWCLGACGPCVSYFLSIWWHRIRPPKCIRALALCECDAALPSRRPRHSSLSACKYWCGRLFSRCRCCCCCCCSRALCVCVGTILGCECYLAEKEITPRTHTEDRRAVCSERQAESMCLLTNARTAHHSKYGRTHPLARCSIQCSSLTKNVCIYFYFVYCTHSGALRIVQRHDIIWIYIVCVFIVYVCVILSQRHIKHAALNLGHMTLCRTLSSIKMFAFFIRQITISTMQAHIYIHI